MTYHQPPACLPIDRSPSTSQEHQMDWVDLYTGFHGRISRQPFWIGVLVLVVVETICQMVAHRLEGDRLGAIVDLAFSYPELALTLKRAHDRNLRTWWVAALFAGSILLDFLAVIGVDTQLGDTSNPNLIGVIVTIPLAALTLLLLVDLGFRAGTKGPNRFGPDPLAHEV
jgi:uncharacterized membrane protein YhaH (DUF805 family)